MFSVCFSFDNAAPPPPPSLACKLIKISQRRKVSAFADAILALSCIPNTPGDAAIGNPSMYVK